ncbi:hypothetical protein [Microbispora triticiradicis]|uniref:hypothetical protein n=1 Tax=Microbispora triticiradicis TaxID=2200763 RepID=UPI001FCE2B68|nr:hypothetical protein [Microbispora triticiradicis]
MNEDKLTAREQEKLNKVAGRLTTWAVWTGAAVLGFLALAIWLGDWRLVGFAVLAGVVGVVLVTLVHFARDPKTAQDIAKLQRDKDRARAEQDAHIKDLERDLGL